MKQTNHKYSLNLVIEGYGNRRLPMDTTGINGRHLEQTHCAMESLLLIAQSACGQRRFRPAGNTALCNQ